MIACPALGWWFFCFFFSSRRRHTRYKVTGVQTCALPILMYFVISPLVLAWIQRPSHPSRSRRRRIASSGKRCSPSRSIMAAPFFPRSSTNGAPCHCGNRTKTLGTESTRSPVGRRKGRASSTTRSSRSTYGERAWYQGACVTIMGGDSCSNGGRVPCGISARRATGGCGTIDQKPHVGQGCRPTTTASSVCRSPGLGASGAHPAQRNRFEGASAHDLEVEQGCAQRAHEPYPDREQHLCAARRGDIAKVDHVAPAEPLLQQLGNACSRRRIVPANEEVVIAPTHPRRVHHHLCVRGVESL